MNGFVDFSKYQKQVAQVSEQYTRMPNHIIDDEIMAQLSDKAFKCYMLITRYTSGYNKNVAQIATATFQKYCGIKKADKVFESIKELEQLKLICVERKTGVLNSYSFVQNHSQKQELPNEGTTPENGDGTTPENGDGTTPENGESYKENSKEKLKENICEIFEFWKTTFKKNASTLLSDKRKSKIQARLKQGYSVDDIRLAITNCSKSKYHMGENESGTVYSDIELICREPEKLDRFISLFPREVSIDQQESQQLPQQPEFEEMEW